MLARKVHLLHSEPREVLPAQRTGRVWEAMTFRDPELSGCRNPTETRGYGRPLAFPTTILQLCEFFFWGGF